MLGEAGFVFVGIALIALLAGFVHSAIGFGFGIVAIALLPYLIDARSAHIVLSACSVPMLTMAAWTFRDGLEWRSLRQALIGAAIFLPLGLLLFESVTLDWLVRGTGVCILAMVFWSMRNQSLGASSVNSGSCFLAGSVGGFLAGAVSIAGPPIAAFALKQDWSQARFKAFLTQCLLAMSLYKVVLLIWRGHFVGEAIPHAAVASVLAIVGVYFGALASRRISPERFRYLVAGALIVAACKMIWTG